ncbi:MAG TPA: helix-turn-helix transcriptional regulator [Acidimicrobiia bacterium]|nr:helix-turn-helix transcriptional regulator [Acidimicrobiia bacterium]
MGRAWDPPGVAADDAGAAEVVRVHLKALRRAHGLSRAQVARSAGLTRRELRRYERGRAVSETDLRSIAGSCGVDVEDLVGAAVGPELRAADDHGTGWDAEWLDTRIDAFLSSDDDDPPYLEIQLRLWDRGSRVWPEPLDAQFPGVVQLALFDDVVEELGVDADVTEPVESLPVARRRSERPLRELGRVQVA